MFEELQARGFQVEFRSHARAILGVDFPGAAEELEAALLGATIPIEEIIAGGGGEAKGTQRLRRALAAAGWRKMEFVVETRINGVARGANRTKSTTSVSSMAESGSPSRSNGTTRTPSTIGTSRISSGCTPMGPSRSV